MSRRDRIDPETARLVEERLQWLLTENGPGPRTPGEAGRPRPGEAIRVSRRAQRSSDLREPDDPIDPIDELEGPGDLGPHEQPATSARAGGGPPQRHRRERAPRPADAAGGAGIVRDARAAAVLAAVGSFRRPHLVVVGVIVALGLLLAGWAVLRARPVAVAVTPPPVAASRAGSPGPSTARDGAGSPGANASPTAPPVVVHVLGAVKKPGLVQLAAGSRVQDALDAAGGLSGRADPGELNLAQPVADGQQIVVGTRAKPTSEVRDGSSGGGGGSSTGSGSGSGSPGSSGQPVNLNTATQAQLEELPGVGPVMAGKIIAWRTEHARFSRIEELQEIDGVGPKTYAKLAPLCQV